MAKIKDFVKRHDKLNVLARCCMDINNPNLVRLIKGYYERSNEYTLLFARHNGTKYQDKMIYHIQYCMPKNNTKIIREGGGFCAVLRITLLSLSFPDYVDLVPVVEWGRSSAYYDSEMDSVTTNVFEYYFEPVSSVGYDEVKDCKNVIEAYGKYGETISFFFMERATDLFASYQIKNSEIEKLGHLYKKYIHLNQNTKAYIDKNLNEILGKGSILGIHVRGTDFNGGSRNHPIVITPEEYLEKTRDVYSKNKYDKVFLATDDENALNLFKREFKDNLLYYADVFRTKNHIGPHNTPDRRPLHYYKLGLEVLRDIYTLANCDSLVCGLSQVSFAARYINVALGRKFNEIVILDNGINAEYSIEAKKRMHKLKKMSRGG